MDGNFSKSRRIVAAVPAISGLETGSTGAAAATIPVILAAMLVEMGIVGGADLSANSPLSQAARVVLSTAPLLLATVAFAMSVSASRLGVRTGTAAPIRLRPTGVSLAAAAVLVFFLLVDPRVVEIVLAILGMFPLFAVLSIYAHPALSLGIWASVIIVGVSIVAAFAQTQKTIEDRRPRPPRFLASVLFLLPCFVLPVSFFGVVTLKPSSLRSATLATVLVPPIVSMAFFGAAFVTALRRRSAPAFVMLRIAGRSMFCCAAELSCIAALLGQPRLC